jgi:hypothetical protein
MLVYQMITSLLGELNPVQPHLSRCQFFQQENIFQGLFPMALSDPPSTSNTEPHNDNIHFPVGTNHGFCEVYRLDPLDSLRQNAAVRWF